MLPYPALLALHLVAVMLFVGGFFLAGLTTPRESDAARDPARRAELDRLRRWNGLATSPALFVLWAAGLMMASQAGWFAWRWLQLKLACVILLTLLHAYQSWRLHRGGSVPRWPLAAATALVAAILYLVGAKPG